MGTPRVVHGDERLAYRAGTTAEVQATLGTKLEIADGRLFRMAQCDTSTALVVAQLTQSPIPSANFTDEALGTIAAGERVIVDPEATTGDATPDLFRNGYFMIDEAAQLDPLHRIDTNTGINETISDQPETPSITLASALQDAIAVGETYSVIGSPYRQILIHASPQTAMTMGVTVRAMAVNVYGWIATQGPTRVKQDGALVVGGGTSSSTSVDGTVIAWVPESATTVNPNPTGTALFSNPTTTADAIVFLRLDSN